MRVVVLCAVLASPGCLPKPVPADELQLAELMIAPLHGDASWVELLNARDAPIDGADIELETSSGVFALDGIGSLEPGALAVVGRGDAVTLELDLTLDPGGDTVILRVGGEEVDRVTYDPATWPASQGASLTRSPSWGRVDDPDGWCDAWTPNAGGDFASPGAANVPCDCYLEYDYLLEQQSPPFNVVSGVVAIQPTHSEGFFRGDGDAGNYGRWTDAGGQRIEWVFSTGVRYLGVRGFGEELWVDQPIEVPVSAGDYIGVWSSVAPCAPLE